MAATDSLRKHHDELVEIAEEIAACLAPTAARADPTHLLQLLSMLAGKLTTHLIIEDKLMYPSLTTHDDQEVRDTAERFVQTMGGLKATFDSYVDRWPSALAIEQNPVTFAAETSTILTLLAQRIERENDELYPMVDKRGPSILGLLLKSHR